MDAGTGHPGARRAGRAGTGPAAAAGLAATLVLTGAAGAAPVARTDFRNFTHTFDGARVPVRDGRFSRTDPRNPLRFEVLRVARGDLGPGGSPAAVVVTLANTGGTGEFTNGLVYVDGPAGPRLLGALGIGDRADGGVFDVRIRRGRILDERYGETGTGACCPTRIETRVFRRVARGLVQVGPATARADVDAQFGTPARPVRLRFLPGTSVGTAAAAGWGTSVVALAARRGQRVTVTARRPAAIGSPPALRIALRRGARDLVTIGPGGRRTLVAPATGTYLLRFTIGRRPGADPLAAADVTITGP